MSDGMPQFVPGPHPSHDWALFEGSRKSARRMCRRCEICTCHSPVASTEPCEYADSSLTAQATPDLPTTERQS